MDVISVFKAGVTNITATLGTALTEDQAKLILKYTNEILLCYDSDEAGQAATMRAIEIVSKVGGRCLVMRLKGAKDPDEYINKNGVAKFKDAMDKAVPSTEYLISLARKKYNLDTPDGKALFVEEASGILAKIPNEIEVDAYLKKIATETDISKDAIYSEVKKQRSKGKISNGETKTIRINANDFKQKKDASNDAEKKLLGIVIGSKSSYNAVKDEFPPNEYSSDILRRLAEIVYSCYERGDILEPPVIMSKFSGEEADIVSGIFCNLEVYSNEKNTVLQLVKKIKIQNLDEMIEQAEKENDAQKLRELLDKRLKLGRE